MTKKCSVLLSCMVLCGVLLMASYGVAGEGKLSGYMFGDYYYILANHNQELEDKDMNGFQFRRIYFTYDKAITDSFSSRLRLEMANAGDFETKAKMSPVVKDAYLKWKAVCPLLPNDKSELLIGISPTPTWSVVEKVWGYRSVEKTPMDLQKFGSSRDFGVAVKVKPVDKVKVHLMVANGASNSSEKDKYKKFLLSLGIEPAKGIIIEAYGDLDTRADSAHRFTLQGFAAYQAEKGRVGVQFVRQTRQKKDADDTNLEILSVFAVAELMEKISVFARFDSMFDANSSGEGISYIPFDATAKANFIVAGLDLTPAKDVHIMPNVEIVIYSEPDDGGETPDTDIIPRLTCYFKF